MRQQPITYPAPATQPSPGPNRLRTAIIGGFAALVALAAIGCGSTDNSTSKTASPTVNPADTTPVGAVWSVPKAFLGEWKGQAADGPVEFDIMLKIDPGKNSEELGNSSITNKITGNRCDAVERVILITETELTLAARPTGGLDCPAGGHPSSVQLTPDGSLTYSAPGTAGGTVTGTLHKT